MSLLIKGMEMPKSCMLCPLCVEEADPANGEMCMVTGTLMPPCTRERLDNCPLIPVPPHGDLIDRDALAKMCQEMQSIEWNNKATPHSWAYAYESFEGDIDNAPTIIPAEPTQINAPNTLDALTNADRIRSMTDEELARFLWQAAPYDNCPPIKCIEFETRKKPTTDECIACWGRWLKQEAEI